MVITISLHRSGMCIQVKHFIYVEFKIKIIAVVRRAVRDIRAHYRIPSTQSTRYKKIRDKISADMSEKGFAKLHVVGWAFAAVGSGAGERDYGNGFFIQFVDRTVRLL